MYNIKFNFLLILNPYYEYFIRMTNYFQILPFELVELILSTNEIWVNLESALPAFARYCRRNKVSFYNKNIRETVFSEHLLITPENGWKDELEKIKFQMNDVRSNCPCYYCHLRFGKKINTNPNELSYTEKYNKIPLIYQQETKVWTTNDGTIHRDHAPAITSKNYECYLRLGKKHRYFAPAEINTTCGVEDFYEEGELCDGYYRKRYQSKINTKFYNDEEEDVLRDYYIRELSLHCLEYGEDKELKVHFLNKKNSLDIEESKYLKEINDIKEEFKTENSVEIYKKKVINQYSRYNIDLRDYDTSSKSNKINLNKLQSNNEEELYFDNTYINPECNTNNKLKNYEIERIQKKIVNEKFAKTLLPSTYDNVVDLQIKGDKWKKSNILNIKKEELLKQELSKEWITNNEDDFDDNYYQNLIISNIYF